MVLEKTHLCKYCKIFEEENSPKPSLQHFAFLV